MRNNWTRIAAILLISAACLWGCQAKDEPVSPDTVIMTVNDLPITQGELDEELAYLKSYREQSDEDLREEILMKQLIRIAAMKSLFSDDIDRLKTEIDEAGKRVQAGEAFDAVARECSDCPSSADGGKLGEFQRDMMVEPFGRYCFTGKAGSVSEPFLTVYGWHIVNVSKAAHQNEEGKDSVEASHILRIFNNGPIRKIIYLESMNADIVALDSRYKPVIRKARKWYAEQLDKMYERERKERAKAREESGE